MTCGTRNRIANKLGACAPGKACDSLKCATSQVLAARRIAEQLTDRASELCRCVLRNHDRNRIVPTENLPEYVEIDRHDRPSCGHVLEQLAGRAIPVDRYTRWIVQQQYVRRELV